MPHLARFIASGATAEPIAPQPLVPAMLWTSALTGRPPEDHGVWDAREPRVDAAGVAPASSLSRRVKALWNIAGQAGLSAHSIGFPATFPAEPIRGVCVSDAFGPRPLDGAVHPPAVAEILGRLLVPPSALAPSALRSLLPGLDAIDRDIDDRPARLAAALAETASLQAILTWILAERPWDFVAVRFEGLARISRDFLAYRPGAAPAPHPRDAALYGGVVDAAYGFFDLMLGALLRAVDARTNVVLFSPYGFRRPYAAGGAGHDDGLRARGVLAALGPEVRPGSRPAGVHLWGLTPTVLTLLGLPYGEDMPGRPWSEVLAPSVSVRSIPGWEAEPGDAGMHPPELRRDPLEVQAELRQMVELGYIDPPDEDHAAAIVETSRRMRFQLGRSLLDDGRRPALAAETFAALVDEAPSDARYRVALAQALFAAGRLHECRRVVEAADPDAGGALAQAALASLDVEMRRPAEGLRRLRRLNPAEVTPAIRALAGRAYVRLGRWEEARQAFAAALEADPDSGAAWQGLALSLLGLRRAEEAAEAAFEAVDRLPLNPLSHYYLGVALSRLDLEGMGQQGAAEAALHKALALAPDMAAAHRRLAQIHRSRGDVVQAAEWLWKARQAAARKRGRTTACRSPASEAPDEFS